MYFSLLFLLGAPLLLAPLRTASLFRFLHTRERQAIAVDNAAIRIAEGDRRILNQLERALQEIKRLDDAHHPIHLCARVPATAAECVGIDKSMEGALQLKHLALYRETQSAWASTTSAKIELAKLTVEGSIQRDFLPLQALTCSQCNAPLGWRIPVQKFRAASVLGSGSGNTEDKVEIYLERVAGLWNYRLKKGER